MVISMGIHDEKWVLQGIEATGLVFYWTSNGILVTLEVIVSTYGGYIYRSDSPVYQAMG